MAKKTDEQKQQDRLIDELLKDYKGPGSFWGESGLFAQLKKRIIDRTLDAEMDHHLGYCGGGDRFSRPNRRKVQSAFPRFIFWTLQKDNAE